MKHIRKFNESIEQSDLLDIKDIFQEYADEWNLSYVSENVIKEKCKDFYNLHSDDVSIGKIKVFLKDGQYTIGSMKDTYFGSYPLTRENIYIMVYLLATLSGRKDHYKFLASMNEAIKRLKSIGYKCVGELMDSNQYYKISIGE